MPIYSLQAPETGDARSRSFATLSDPRFVVALVILIVNDRLLKSEYGNWLTGKLSDVAGLVVLPVVVAGVLATLRVPRSSAVACLSIGTWFAAIKTLDPAARATERLAEAVSGSASVIVVDPSDLIGLGGLLLAGAIIARPKPLLRGTVARAVLFAVAMLACTATSNSGGTPTDLAVTPDGAVVSSGGDSVSEPLEDPSGEQPAVGLGERVTEVCATGPEAAECFRIVDGRVERQEAGGEWELEWALFNTAIVSNHVGAGLNYLPSMNATDIVASPDGSVHVAFDGISPIARSSTGEWKPSVATYRPIGALLTVIVLAYGAAVVAAAAKMPGARMGTAALAIGATLAFYLWVNATGLIGPQISGAILVVLTFLGLLWAAFAELDNLVGQRGNVKVSLAVGAVGIVAALVCLLVWKYVVGAPALLWALAPVPALLGVLGANAVTVANR